MNCPKGSLPLGDDSAVESSPIEFKSHFLASCCSLSANLADVALSISKRDLGWGIGGLDCSVFLLLSLSLLLSILVFEGGGTRGTLMVAVTEFDSSISKSFSRRDAS